MDVWRKKWQSIRLIDFIIDNDTLILSAAVINGFGVQKHAAIRLVLKFFKGFKAFKIKKECRLLIFKRIMTHPIFNKEGIGE